MEKFWKQVFIASISSGSSVESSIAKADKAVLLIKERESGKPGVVKLTHETSLMEVLPSGVVNCLRSEDIHTVGDFHNITLKKLLNIRNFGQGSLKQVTELIETYTNMPVSIYTPLKLNKTKTKTTVK